MAHDSQGCPLGLEEENCPLGLEEENCPLGLEEENESSAANQEFVKVTFLPPQMTYHVQFSHLL